MPDFTKFDPPSLQLSLTPGISLGFDPGYFTEV